MSSDDTPVNLFAAIVEASKAPDVGPHLDSCGWNLRYEGLDYRPERDQLYDSLNQWSNDRFRRQYRMNRCCMCVV